jgi:hypothetical protein
MSIRKWINRLYSKKHITIRDENLDYYVDKLKNNLPFSFSRFGDGEWNAILGKTGKNIDGHKYTKELGESLRQCLSNVKKYYYGIQPFALTNLGRAIALYLDKHTISLNWHNASVFHDANIENRLAPFIQQLKNMDVTIIGPAYLRQLQQSVLQYIEFVEIPQVNCFESFNLIKEEVEKKGKERKGVVYLFSASMASNGLIHTLYDTLGPDNWLIDVGSLWDIYVGVNSRSVYENRDWTDIIKRNLAP